MPTRDYRPGTLSLLLMDLFHRSVDPVAISQFAPQTTGVSKVAGISSTGLSKLNSYIQTILRAPFNVAGLMWILFLILALHNGDKRTKEIINHVVSSSTPGTSYIDQLMQIAKYVQNGGIIPTELRAGAISGMKLSADDEVALVKLAATLTNMPENEYAEFRELVDASFVKQAGLIGSAVKYIGLPIVGYGLGSMPATLAKRKININNMYGDNTSGFTKVVSSTGPVLGTIGALTMFKPTRKLPAQAMKWSLKALKGTGSFLRGLTHR
jgi:hypothetical protein